MVSFHQSNNWQGFMPCMDEIDLYTIIIGGHIPDLNNYLSFDTEFCLIVVKHMRKLLTLIDSSD